MADFLRRGLLSTLFRRAAPIRVLKRSILSSSFIRQEKFNKFLEQRKLEIADQNLSSICLLIDRCSEKKMPFSSLTIDSMVHAIEDRDDIVSSMYYLHKFRHCDTCYFLRPWTCHAWVRKCLEFNALDLALKALDENSQYGIFPDDIVYCLLVDRCLKEQNYDLAFKFVSHMFLSETLDTRLSQLVCLSVVIKMIEKENLLNPRFSSPAEQRNFSGLCLRLGQLLNIKPIKILGLSNLGSIEKEHGIRSIYQEPWGPLMWTEGYLEQAISELTNGNGLMHSDILNNILELVKDDEIQTQSVNEVVSSLESRGLVTGEPLIKTLEDTIVLPQLVESESLAMQPFHEIVELWVSEHRQLSEVENQIEKEQVLERQHYFESKRLEKLAKKMAVEKLGYWEFFTDDAGHESVPLHLGDDYVSGSSSDLEIERRINSKNL